MRGGEESRGEEKEERTTTDKETDCAVESPTLFPTHITSVTFKLNRRAQTL